MLKIVSLFFALLLFSVAGVAQPDFSKTVIKTHQVTANIYMLEGVGGNIGLLVGDDGAFLVDDQYAPLTARIVEAISEVTSQPVRYLANTHWHGDHAGGNENFGKAGALIFAHKNVRQRMKAGGTVLGT